MKVLIYTYAAKRSDFIQMQYKALKKFVKHDFDYLVFNLCPAFDGEAIKDINDTCKKIGVRCVDLTKVSSGLPGGTDPVGLPNGIVNWSFRNVVLKEPYDLSLAIDFDAFPLKPFGVIEKMCDCDMAGLPQGRAGNSVKPVGYLWPGLLFLNLASLPDKESIDFSGGTVRGLSVDAGGQLAHYLEAHPSLRIKHIRHTSHCSHAVFASYFVDEIAKKYDLEFKFEICDRNFLHYGSGTNWNHKPQEFVSRKTGFLNEILSRRMADEPVFDAGTGEK